MTDQEIDQIVEEYRQDVDETDREEFDEYADQYRTYTPEEERDAEGLREFLSLWPEG